MKKSPGGTWFSGAPKLIALVGVFCIVVIAAAAGFLTYRVIMTHGRILPNISIGLIDVGGLKPAEAETRLQKALRDLNLSGVGFTYEDRALAVQATEARQPSTNNLIAYDIKGMTEAAYAYGHGGNVIDLAKANVKALLSQVILPVKVDIDREGLRDLLAAKFGSYEREYRNADLDVQTSTVIAPATDQSATATPVTQTVYGVSVLPDVAGFAFNYDEAIDAATSKLTSWQGSDTTLTLKNQLAEITATDAELLVPSAQNILTDNELNLAYDDLKWPLDKSMLAESLMLKRRVDGKIVVGIRPSMTDGLLSQIAAAVETDSKPTHLKLTADGTKVDQDTFVGGQIGKSLDREATIMALEDRMADGKADDVPVAVNTVYDAETDPLAETMGVRELLGVGTSVYTGSPANRMKNIANGAKLLGGSIIKPGEEFSTLAPLRPFTVENGYFPELVIRDNRTVPDIGGGLCQIGTTMFRATMASGLPVTMRQNHSYRVVYYEPAGTDATIYDPAPDFRFVNDTGSDIVVITKVLPKSKLSFEFWGTRDGRVQKQGPIKIWDETSPPDPKLIETSGLADGKKKCFESAHKGAKTSFTYTITYPDGRVKAKTFTSFYKPWQQQCLVGKTGAPNIVIAKDGSIKEIAPAQPVTPTTGLVQAPGFSQ
jgi:vancomycin resistance protein YoaR